MKQLLSNLRTGLALAAIALAVAASAQRAKADEWNKRTVLTVNQTIQIRDTVLEPGQYVLQLLNSDSDRHIVQIFNGDQSRIVDTILTIPSYRMHAPDKTQFTFWETPPGTAKAMRDWYYPGDTMGEEFPYPKTNHMLELAMVDSSATTSASTVTTTEPATAPPAPPEPAVDRATPEMTQPETPAPAETPAEPAAPAVDQAAPNPPPPADSQTGQAPPAELPKTGSQYPLLGITGLSLLALGGLLRLRRPA